MSEDSKRGPGKPSDYDPDFHPRVFIEMSKTGRHITQIAKDWGVATSTIHDWIRNYPEFDYAVKKGKDFCAAWYIDLGQQSMLGKARDAKTGEPIKVSLGWYVWMTKNILKWSDSHHKDQDFLDLLSQSGLSKEEIIQIIQDKRIEQKISYREVCEKTGYPPPYPKQLEMMQFGINEVEPRLLLGARGYGKTDYVVILGIAFKLYLDPKFTVLIITKSDQRNAAMLAEVGKVLKTLGVLLEKQNASCIRIAGLLGKDHSVSAVSIGTSSLRGRHPKMIVMDDPVTEEDVSEATRKKVQRVYNEVSKLCTNILVIGQPVHKHDLYETLRPLLKKMEVPHGSIPELDHDLEAQRLAGVDEASIQASYHLKVTSEGGSPFERVKYLDKFPTGGTSVAFIDPSDGGNETAVSIFTAYGQAMAVVGFSWKRAWNYCLDDIALLFQKYNTQKVCFETNKHGLQPLDILRDKFKNIGVMGRHSNNNKHSRIMAAGTFAHLIHIARESNKSYIDQVIKYELGVKVDDAPDSLATGLEWIGLIRGKQ